MEKKPFTTGSLLCQSIDNQIDNLDMQNSVDLTELH